MRNIFSRLASLVAIITAAASVAPRADTTGSAYDFEFGGIDGTPIKLSQWRGKVLLVVNTASFCGFTKQYAGLQELWTRYGNDGLVVLGVPANDFGSQEPKSEGEIKKFCEGGFGITFPLTSKQVVVGPNAHPFYLWAAQAVGPEGVPAWNFHKYLVGRDGRIIGAFASRVTPDSKELVGAIEGALNAKAADAAPAQSAVH